MFVRDLQRQRPMSEHGHEPKSLEVKKTAWTQITFCGTDADVEVVTTQLWELGGSFADGRDGQGKSKGSRMFHAGLPVGRRSSESTAPSTRRIRRCARSMRCAS